MNGAGLRVDAAARLRQLADRLDHTEPARNSEASARIAAVAGSIIAEHVCRTLLREGRAQETARQRRR